MKLSVLLILFTASYSAGSSTQDYSDFNDEDFKVDLFLYESEADNLTTEVEGVSLQEDETDIELTTVISTTADTISSSERKDDGNFTDDVNLKMENENALVNVTNEEEDEVEVSPTPAVFSGAKSYLEELPHKQPRDNEQEKKHFFSKAIKSMQALKRREIGNNVLYESPDGMESLETFPLNDEFYYASEAQQPQIDYFDYSIPQVGQDMKDVNDSNNMSGSLTETSAQQYLQKNYYYNYYPMARKIPKMQKWAGENNKSIIPGEPIPKQKRPGPRKYIGKNSCKQYLEFLKFAFEKLDETSDYEYEEVDNDYNYDDDLLSENQKPMFKAQVFGPSLFVDNSGKVFKMDPQRKFYLPLKPQPPLDPNISNRFHQPSPSPYPPDFPFTTFNPPFENSPSPNIFSNYDHSVQFGKTMTTNMAHPITRIPETIDQSQKDYGEYNLRTTTQRYPAFDDRANFSTFNFEGTPWQMTDYTTDRVPTTFQTMPHWSKKEHHTTNLDIWPKYSVMTTSTPYTITTSKEDDYGYFTSESDEGYPFHRNKGEIDCNDKMLPCPVTYNITYPLNGYCNRFVSCESGTAVRRTCPEGLHFNLITKSCDLPHNSICAYACPEVDGYYGIPGDCGGYFKCKNSVAEYRMCPPKMHWNSNTEICTFEELSSCPMKCSSKNEIKRYDGNCQAYIICLQGVAYFHKCPANTNFDPKVMTCIPEHLSKCQNNPKLLTKYLNPNHLCKDVNMKMIPGTPCELRDLPKKRKEKEIIEH